MNTPIDSNDDTAELQAVMGDYFAALLHDSTESPVLSACVEAVAIPVTTVAVEQPVAEAKSAAADAMPRYQLIRIGGLTLGIPMQAIAEIVTAPSQWTPLSDARTWVLGSYSGRSEFYTVVDTAALLVPGGTLQTVAVGSNAVLLAGQRWALACDGIGEQITPDPAQVNWRGAQGKRPWLAGTVRVPTCALLDIPELLRLLDA